MLVVPYSKTYNDSRFLMNPGFASPRDFLDTMVMGLDELLREGAERRTMMTVAVHARWSGQAARAAALRLFIEHAQAQPGVAFMRRRDIARWWLEHVPAGMRCVVFHGVGRPRGRSPSRSGPTRCRAAFEVVIAPPFAGVNPADVLQREGRHPVPPGSPTDVPGLEVAGHGGRAAATA